MSLEHLTLKDVDEKALDALVESGVAESRTLEFKQDLQVATDEQKQEFLSDVTALANTDGGDIVFGIRAEKGVAKELVGLKNFVPDDRIVEHIPVVTESDPGTPEGGPVQSVFVKAEPDAVDDRIDHHRGYQNETRDQ